MANEGHGDSVELSLRHDTANPAPEQFTGEARINLDRGLAEFGSFQDRIRRTPLPLGQNDGDGLLDRIILQSDDLVRAHDDQGRAAHAGTSEHLPVLLAPGANHFRGPFLLLVFTLELGARHALLTQERKTCTGRSSTPNRISIRIATMAMR